jgi:hypothetical protein
LVAIEIDYFSTTDEIISGFRKFHKTTKLQQKAQTSVDVYEKQNQP